MKYFSILLMTTALIACQPKDAATSDTTQTKTAQSQTAPAVDTSNMTESERLNAWFETGFNDNIKDYPQFMTTLGMKDRMDEWNDSSRAFSEKQYQKGLKDLAEMKSKFDYDKLNEDAQLSWRLYEKSIEDSTEGRKWWDHNYAFHQMYGAQKGIPTFLINNHRISSQADAEAYITRLETVDDYFGEIIDNSIRSFDKGIVPPKFVFPYIIQDAKNVLQGAPLEDTEELNLLLSDFKKKVEKLELDDDTKTGLYSRAIEAIQSDVAPVYQRFIAEMQRQEAAANTDDGVWKLPNGDDFYAYRLSQMTTTELSAKEIHEIGLSEVARIQDEMRDIMVQVDFKGDLQEFFEFLRTDPQFYYPETEDGKQAYLKEATRLIDVMREKIPDYFRRAPKAPMEVRAVEPFREKSAGKAFYSRPAPDGSRPGYYYANLYKMADMPIYQMEALAYHEGIPGHHMQIAISQELENVPKFRKFGGYTPYSEGWGLYTEYLPKEMGFYQDPYSDFGRLAMEIWRAARLVVDTGLHDKKWTREEAIQYLKDNTPNPEGDIVKAIERYIVMPGQATAYKIGMLKILELREMAKDELGDKFDIRDFHEAILATGPVPLYEMENSVKAYIETAQKDDYLPERL